MLQAGSSVDSNSAEITSAVRYERRFRELLCASVQTLRCRQARHEITVARIVAPGIRQTTIGYLRPRRRFRDPASPLPLVMARWTGSGPPGTPWPRSPTRSTEGLVVPRIHLAPAGHHRTGGGDGLLATSLPIASARWRTFSAAPRQARPP
jgi:hypothetical protein